MLRNFWHLAVKFPVWQ